MVKFGVYAGRVQKFGVCATIVPEQKLTGCSIFVRKLLSRCIKLMFYAHIRTI